MNAKPSEIITEDPEQRRSVQKTPPRSSPSILGYPHRSSKSSIFERTGAPGLVWLFPYVLELQCTQCSCYPMRSLFSNLSGDTLKVSSDRLFESQPCLDWISFQHDLDVLDCSIRGHTSHSNGPSPCGCRESNHADYCDFPLHSSLSS